MKAISIQQPWAWAILHAGKSVENRSWPTSFRGSLAIHAGLSRKSHAAQDADEWPERYGVALPPWDSLVTGAVVGLVDVIDCVPLVEVDSPWAFGPWCWILANPRAVEPMPLKGKLSLFTLPDPLASHLSERRSSPSGATCTAERIATHPVGPDHPDR